MSEPGPQIFSHYPSWPAPVRVPLTVLPEHPCVYLPGRRARLRAFAVHRLSPRVYHELMDAGFRRSGHMVYQPACRGCRACVPIRVPVERFRPGRTQRRCLRRNADLRITVGRPAPTDEKFALYRRYMAQWHGKPGETRHDFETFLYDSPLDTIEFCYRGDSGAADALVAIGICDVCPSSLSSVYFYFDPRHARRGLGTFGALVEIERARSLGIPYYYLGYWVGECGAMSYKASFRPHQVLDTDGVWRDSSPPPSAARQRG